MAMADSLTETSTSKRFRIAFSFAGEKRNFVAQVADLLANRFGEEKILYDKFHEAEFAEADLAFDLPAHYKNNSDLIVAVFLTARRGAGLNIAPSSQSSLRVDRNEFF